MKTEQVIDEVMGLVDYFKGATEFGTPEDAQAAREAVREALKVAANDVEKTTLEWAARICEAVVTNLANLEGRQKPVVSGCYEGAEVMAVGLAEKFRKLKGRHDKK